MMSRMCTIGRQGVPSLLTRIRPVVIAEATKSFNTRSSRRRGDAPYAVAFLIYVGQKFSSASRATSRSTSTLDTPYGVTGFSSAVSSRKPPPAAPYVLQEEENTKRLTPACFASSANRTEAL